VVIAVVQRLLRHRIHSRHFRAKYLGKKTFFRQNLVTFQNLFKPQASMMTFYTNCSIHRICGTKLSKNKYFQCTKEKNIGWKMSFYIFIAIWCTKMYSVYRALYSKTFVKTITVYFGCNDCPKFTTAVFTAIAI